MIKQDELKNMFGGTPERFTRRVSLALMKTEEKPMKRLTARTLLIAALILVLLLSAAYAAFSSQVTELFGRMYGNDMKEWLEKGDTAIAGQTLTVDGVVFSLDEVVYRDNGLYGVGTIRAADERITLIAEDCFPDEPYGYDTHGALGQTEEAPDGTKTVAEIAAEKGGRLLMVRATPDKIGVDGGAALAPGEIGVAAASQRDGSIRYTFEVSDALAVEEGTTYEITMRASLFSMTPDGTLLTDTRHSEYWVVKVQPTPNGTEKAANSDRSGAVLAVDEAQIVLPDEYRLTGTMPIYRAVARDLTKVSPELFNQTGIKSRTGAYDITFNDGAQLALSPEALFYNEYSGTFDANAGEPALGEQLLPKPALSSEIASLASWARHGWPGTGEIYQLDKTQMTQISLIEAQAALEALLEQLGLTGYTMNDALDMSVERIVSLGNAMNAMRVSGEIGGSSPTYDYDGATAADEGYYLSYYRFPGAENANSGALHSVVAYVTGRGVVCASIRAMYAVGDVYDTPKALVTMETVLSALEEKSANARFDNMKAEKILNIYLTYAPARAQNKADGMVFTPVWLVVYQDAKAIQNNWTRYAEFNAVTGDLLGASFQ